MLFCTALAEWHRSRTIAQYLLGRSASARVHRGQSGKRTARSLSMDGALRLERDLNYRESLLFFCCYQERFEGRGGYA